MNESQPEESSNNESEMPVDNPEIKKRFINGIIKSRNLSEESRINLLIGLEGTLYEGLAIKAFNDDKKSSQSIAGVESKAKKQQDKDDFTKEKFFEMLVKHPKRSNRECASNLITEHGSEIVGAHDVLRRKMSVWRKSKN